MKNLTAFCFAAVALCLIMISASALELGLSGLVVLVAFVGGVGCIAQAVRIWNNIQKEVSK